MLEKFEQGTLCSEEEWKAHIEKLLSKTKPTTKKEVEDALINSVKKRIPAEKFGLFLSGGIDSSLLALLYKKFTNNFICYCVGIEGSHDISAAKKAAKELGLELKTKTYTAQEVEDIFKKIHNWFSPSVVTLGVASVIYAASELAKQDGIKTFIGGLGSEEIFAGYERHSLAKDINEECWRGLFNLWKADLIRDHTLGEKLEIKVLCPFLDDNLIIAAMGIHGNEKIVKGERKHFLRALSHELGLPHDIAFLPKKAAQYGSGFDKIIDKLAQKKKISKRDFVLSL